MHIQTATQTHTVFVFTQVYGWAFVAGGGAWTSVLFCTRERESVCVYHDGLYAVGCCALLARLFIANIIIICENTYCVGGRTTQRFHRVLVYVGVYWSWSAYYFPTCFSYWCKANAMQFCHNIGKLYVHTCEVNRYFYLQCLVVVVVLLMLRWKRLNAKTNS